MVAQTVNKGSRGGGKQYGKMLVLAFGLAVIAVMVVHKLRERRILNLIVEEKDQQLSSLQLLLQREVDFNKEMSKRVDDLKPRLHMLRSQKMELNGRVVELQSTIASLKDEVKVVESALEVRNGENRMLREKIIEISKEKDAEIEQLKRGREDARINKVGEEEDLKRVEESEAGESSNVMKIVEDEVQVKESDVEISRGGVKLEVASESKYGHGIGEDEKQKESDFSRTKGKKWKAVGRSKRLERVMVMRKRKVSGRDHIKHDEVHDTRSENATDEAEVSRIGQIVALKTEEGQQRNHRDADLISQGNQVTLTTEKSDDKNSSGHELKVEDVSHELKGTKEELEVKQFPVKFTITSQLKNTLNLQDSETVDARGDLILHQEKEHALQDSEAENGGGSNTEENYNGSSDSEFMHDQHDLVSEENDSDTQSDMDLNMAEAEDEPEIETEQAHTFVEDENEEYNA